MKHRPRLPVVVRAVALALVLACGRGAADETGAAPADAWPMSRGSRAGTGRSAASLAFPLTEAWHRGFEKTAFGATPVVAGGTIFVGDLDGTFHALSLDDGHTLWTYTAEAAGFPSSAAASLDPAAPLVVVGDDTGVVRAFESGNGTVVWTYETGGEISGGPTIVGEAGQGRVLVGSQDASLSCLRLADGGLVWKHSIADQIRCAPTVAGEDEAQRVFLAGCDGKLHVIDAVTGEERASVPIDGPTGTTPAAVDDRVFFGTEGGGFFAIDYTTASVAWRAQGATQGQSYRSSAAVAADLVVVGSRGKAVEAFTRRTGDRAWRRPMRGRVDGSPAVVASADGGLAVLVADAAGTILALDAATGEPRWQFDAGGGFSSGAAVASGRVVIASDDGTVWCFRSPAAQPPGRPDTR